MEAMGSQQQPGSAGRKRIPNRERPAAEDDALNQIAREAEARLAAKRAARAEAREIRMKELERQQKEKYYGLDTKFGDIEQWMEDSERYTRKSRRNASASDEDERMSVGSRGSLRASCYSDLSLHSTGFPSKSQPSSQNGNRPSLLYSDALPARSYRASLYDENFNTGTRRYSASSSRPPSEYSCYIGSGSRASSRASSARASPVVEERPEKDFEKGVRTASSLSAATLASLGGTSSRRGSGDTSISVDTEASIREIKDINELKDQIQDVEGKYKQELKEMKDSLAEVEEKYKKAMVSNAQLDNEKTNFMYQVDNLKDALFELEEELAESKREYDEKSKEFEREKHAHNTLKFQFVEVKEALKQREELLAEIRQLQQKQEGYVREISDLQETIEWKEKKIGALERQKEFFDSIRCERDDLREEVVLLKEQLKQYGIIPNLEVATNGETSGGLHNDGLSSSSKMVSGTSHIPGGPEDGMLGKANEVEMKNEIVENVGKREILQNTEHEEHTEETKEQEIVQECSEIKTLHADENAEAEKITEGKVASTLVLNSGLEEPPKSHTEHVPGIVCSPKNSDVVEFCIEGRSIGDTSEEKELNENDVNKVSTQSKETSPGIEVGEAISTGLEMLPQKQNNEKQAVDVGEDNHNEIFQDALEFVNDSQAAASSDSETPDLVGDMLSKTSAIHSDIEQSENKIIEDDLLIKEQGITITTKEKQADGTDEDDKKENVVQHQSDKADSTVEHTEAAWAREQTPDDLTEEQGITITTKEKQGDGIDEDDKMENVVQHQSAKADSTVEHTESSWAREETPDDLTEEQGITITTKEKQDGGTDEDDKKENVVQQQSDKADTTVEHTESAWGREQTPDDLTEEQIQVEETQTSSSSHDSSTEEEDIEQQPKASEDNHGESLAKGTEQREAVLRTQEENAISEKNDKQISMTDINPENIVVDGIEQNECQTHERKQVDLKNESRKGSKLKTEIINDEKTLVEIPYKSEDAAAAESQDNPAFTEEPRALEFVNDSQAAVSSHSETPDLVGDLLSKTSAIHSDIEQSENKIIEGDLLIKEQGITITNEEKQDDGTDEDDKKENVVQQQSDKADSTVEHTESSWAKEQTLDDLTEEEIQVGAEETQTSSSNHDSSTEEEDIEQQLKASEDNHGESLAKGTEQGEAVLRTQEENAISEKNDKQISMTDIHPENIVDAIEQNECQTPERKQLDLKDDSRKACQESQSDPQVGRIGKGKSRDDCVIS
ncbi:leucine-rich repeat flightless-interacting protein 1 isoform X8 [Anolis sagrei]|uniref:leucine-rich repeat flightless-interacting protein 1 isoform X8 n=1 Tax=Anolis sagrei TaxID=38937 RepID=UPI003521A487